MIMITLSLLTSMIFLFLNHPLSFGLTLLVQTMMVSMISGLISLNFWFSYILFLVMVGGLLVLFMYMTSIASNEKFKLSKMIIFFTIMLSSMFILSMFMDSFFFNESMINNETLFKMNKEHLSLTKYINYPMNKIMMILISYLFITLIMVVKITKINYGPLRQKT